MKPQHFQRCQVETPNEVVSLIWRLALERRGGARFGSVIDFGAGDARFANVANAYLKYVGVELDKKKASCANPPSNASITVSDALKWSQGGFDLCIGNPPYIRHHHLEPKWRSEALSQFERDLGVALKRTANAYILFLLQALRHTKNDGLVIQLIPFEWVTRPSAKELRDYIQANKWDVSVYRFDTEIFPTVLTTASVTIIDKRSHSAKWRFGVIGRDGTIKHTTQPSGSQDEVLEYADRSAEIYGLRGLSPGGQDIFVLTEEERLYHSLRKSRDVVPCVTSMRHLSAEVLRLDKRSFEQHYVEAGKRCWLIRSDRDQLSDALSAYLQGVGERWKAYSTCTTRDTWWRYKPHPKPALLFSSGFVGRTTKVVVNESGAIAVGSVYGIIANGRRSSDEIAKKLRHFDFERRVVSHSNNLKKVEVRQLNAVLAELI